MNSVAITLHGVGYSKRSLEPGEWDVWISPGLLQYVLSEATKATILTVDDGNKSDIEVVLPLVVQAEMKGLFFMPCEKIGTPSYVTNSDVRKLFEAGMIIGSHGMNHVNWTHLEDSVLRYEIVDSKKYLEDLLGVEIDTISCPFGAYDRRVLRAIKGAGYRKVFTSDGGNARLDHWIIPRNSIHRTDIKESVSRLLRGETRMLKRSEISIKRFIKRFR